MPESAYGTLERVEVTGLPRTCGAQVTARMSVRAARCARGLCRSSPCTRRSPGGARAGTRTGNPGPSGLDQNPGPGCPGGGTARARVLTWRNAQKKKKGKRPAKEEGEPPARRNSMRVSQSRATGRRRVPLCVRNDPTPRCDGRLWARAQAAARARAVARGDACSSSWQLRVEQLGVREQRTASSCTADESPRARRAPFPYYGTWGVFSENSNIPKSKEQVEVRECSGGQATARELEDWSGMPYSKDAVSSPQFWKCGALYCSGTWLLSRVLRRWCVAH